MVRTDAHMRRSRSSLEQRPGTGTTVTVSRRVRISHFLLHLVEMSAAMIVPAIPFIILAGLHVISGTACRAYMPLSIVAMIGLMIYRWDMYSMPMRGLRLGHLRH